MQVLQDQLSDAIGDLSTARRKEEALKTELVHATTKLEDRGAELAKSQVVQYLVVQNQFATLHFDIRTRNMLTVAVFVT